MTLKVSVYIAASLDGFIARRNGDIDWLTGGEGGEDYGYAEFISGIDHIVMGRNTYEKVLTFGGWHYDKKVIVLTSRDLTPPPGLADKIEALHLSPGELVNEMDARGAKHIYLVNNGKKCPQITGLKSPLLDDLRVEWDLLSFL